jgi:hypothetical protein
MCVGFPLVTLGRPADPSPDVDSYNFPDEFLELLGRLETYPHFLVNSPGTLD